MNQITPLNYSLISPVTHNISNDSINQLINRSYDVIVDIGCGDGSLTKLLANQLTHNQLIGIDCVPDMISYARKHNNTIDGKDNPNNHIIEYVVQDMSVDWPAMCPQIRQLESKVDLIFSNYALQYIPDKQQLMQTFSRLLSTGGTVFANIFLYNDLNKKLLINGPTNRRQQRYQTIAEQIANWKQCLTISTSSDNQYLFSIKQFKTLDTVWPMDRKTIIGFMPVMVNSFRSQFTNQSDFDSELNDHLWDTVFDATTNPTATEPNPSAWQQFLADTTVTKVNCHRIVLQLMAIKQ
ncbi:uncharacterized protein LOC128954156 [Oppia nitens]|uniref:uncharacterized protein LOC128954156 n=1 Tax=Oppia nitens TaxID=1686743 RepID=UPI0023DA61AD|nr:uncharacterized protein LOC128954156 [Oppia nitens]